MTDTASTERLANWAGNLTYNAERLVAPGTVGEVQAAVRGAAKLRALGSRHCFNDIADTPGTQVSTERLRRVVSIDAATNTVTVEGGVGYADLCPRLHDAGYALHNLASLPHISIAGAVATATHGSGAVGSLATAVTAIEFVNGRGDLISLSRATDGDTFAGAVVNLGALGVATRLTLAMEPAFDVRQYLYEDLPVAAAAEHFDAVMSAGYSVSLFTDWRGDTINQMWIKSRDENFVPPPTFLGARPATRNLHPITALDATNCTDQMGVAGSWFDRLPHFRIGSTPASGAEMQVEYFVPREHAAAAVRTLSGWGERLAPVLMISEVRTIAADDLWMSPYYKQDCVAFHFSFEKDWPALRQLLPGIEEALAPYAPRPHWGKLFTLPPKSIQARYPRLADFRDLCATHDPEGKFRNAYVETYVFGGG